MKLTTKDWKLIAEALEMRKTDYCDEHPEQERLNGIYEEVCKKAHPPNKHRELVREVQS